MAAAFEQHEQDEERQVDGVRRFFTRDVARARAARRAVLTAVNFASLYEARETGVAALPRGASLLHAGGATFELRAPFWLGSAAVAELRAVGLRATHRPRGALTLSWAGVPWRGRGRWGMVADRGAHWWGHAAPAPAQWLLGGGCGGRAC